MACCESFELHSNGSAIAAQKDSFTWYNNTGAELNGRPLYESLNGKSLIAYKSQKGWSVVYGDPSQVDNTPAIINFNCLDECPNKCLNKNRLEYWDDPSNGYKRDDKTISLTCPPTDPTLAAAGLGVGGTVGVVFASLAIITIAIFLILLTWRKMNKANTEPTETFMTSNTNTKIQKIDNVHVTNRVWNNRNAVIKELPDFLKGAMLFQLPYKDIQRGTIFSITACEQSDVVIAHEDAKVNGRNGWSEDTLRIDGIRGWQPCPAPVLTIVSNNTPFCTLPKIWSRGLQKGQTMELPEVETSETVAAIFVVEGGRKHDHGVIIEWDPDLPNTGMLKKNKNPIGSKQSNLESFPIRNPHAYTKQNTQHKPHLSYSRTQNDKNGL